MLNPRFPGTTRFLLIAATVLLPACGSSSSSGPDPEPELALTVETTRLEELPAAGDPATLDIATWNIEWFGDLGNGPGDEERQLANVAYIMDGLEIDLWSVQEVVSVEAFTTLVDRLPRFEGLLASDPSVVDGPAYYSQTEQKVGLVYRIGAVTVDSARVILSGEETAFAGRPPVEVHLTLAGGPAGVASGIVVILLHAKAGDSEDDKRRREAAASALKSYLDARYPDRAVLVAGDFNDDIDTSIASGDSPYAAFVEDSADYRFVTDALSTAGVSSTTSYPDMIDHQLVTDELARDYIDGSADVFPADDYLTGYAETTSDHYPVLARYTGSEAPRIAAAALGRVWLRWTGATSDSVAVFRDGLRLRTTANDGRFLDEVRLPADSITYRVCEAGTERCSNDATAAF